MAEDLTGGCLCGAVTYRCIGEPQSMGLCQCERCQRQSGSAFLIAMVYPKAAVMVSGRLNCFSAKNDDGDLLNRHFCGTCGTSLMITLDRYPEIRSIMGGTVDDKTRIRPTFSLWCSSAQPWLVLPDKVEQFADYPDGLIA